MVAYFSGAGRDAYALTVTEEIEGKREGAVPPSGRLFSPKWEQVSYEFCRRTKDK